MVVYDGEFGRAFAPLAGLSHLEAYVEEAVEFIGAEGLLAGDDVIIGDAHIVEIDVAAFGDTVEAVKVAPGVGLHECGKGMSDDF